MNARAYLTVLRLDPGPSKHADQQLAGHHLRVSSGRLWMPKQGSGRFAGRARLFTSVEVRAEERRRRCRRVATGAT